MIKNIYICAALCLGAIGLGGVLEPAQAQLSTGGPKILSTPAEESFLSPGGVDLQTGRYMRSETDLRIGDAGPGSIELTRTTPPIISGHISPFGSEAHNWDISISEKRINIQQHMDEHGSGNDFRVAINRNGVTATFQSKLTSVGFGRVSRGPYGSLTFVGDKASASALYTYTAHDGTVINFRPIGSGDCAPTRRCAYASDLTKTDGTKYSFDYDYAPLATGNKARLRSIVSSAGYAVLLEGANGLVTKACTLNLSRTTLPADGLCPANAETTASYSYVGGKLASITGADGQTSTITYTVVGTNTEVAYRKPGATNPWLTNVTFKSLDHEYVNQDVVQEQLFATGEKYTYTWNHSPPASEAAAIVGGRYASNQGHVGGATFWFWIMPGTGPGDPCSPAPCVNRRENIVYQQTPGPRASNDGSGAIQYDYCDPQAWANLPGSNRCLVGFLQTSTTAEGNKTTYETDSFGKIHKMTTAPRPGFTEPDIVLSVTYDCINRPKSCAKPVTYTDAKGNVTAYSYALEHGGMLTKMDPAPAAGGARPLTVHTYAQKYAYIKNASGMLVPAATPIWVPATMTLCQTVAGSAPAPACDGVAPQQITTYEYGPDGTAGNLLPRGMAITAAGQTLRSCYGYDALGRKISETAPAADLAVCP